MKSAVLFITLLFFVIQVAQAGQPKVTITISNPNRAHVNKVLILDASTGKRVAKAKFKRNSATVRFKPRDGPVDVQLLIGGARYNLAQGVAGDADSTHSIPTSTMNLDFGGLKINKATLHDASGKARLYKAKNLKGSFSGTVVSSDVTGSYVLKIKAGNSKKVYSDIVCPTGGTCEVAVIGCAIDVQFPGATLGRVVVHRSGGGRVARQKKVSDSATFNLLAGESYDVHLVKGRIRHVIPGVTCDGGAPTVLDNLICDATLSVPDDSRHVDFRDAETNRRAILLRKQEAGDINVQLLAGHEYRARVRPQDKKRVAYDVAIDCSSAGAVSAGCSVTGHVAGPQPEPQASNFLAMFPAKSRTFHSSMIAPDADRTFEGGSSVTLALLDVRSRARVEIGFKAVDGGAETVFWARNSVPPFGCSDVGDAVTAALPSGRHGLFVRAFHRKFDNGERTWYSYSGHQESQAKDQFNHFALVQDESGDVALGVDLRHRRRQRNFQPDDLVLRVSGASAGAGLPQLVNGVLQTGSSISTWIGFGGRRYATQQNGQHDRHQRVDACDNNPQTLPEGWRLADDSDDLDRAAGASFWWQARSLTYSSGNAYFTRRGKRAGDLHAADQLINSQTIYFRSRHCNRPLFLVSDGQPGDEDLSVFEEDNVIVHRGVRYATLDFVPAEGGFGRPRDFPKGTFHRNWVLRASAVSSRPPAGWAVCEDTEATRAAVMGSAHNWGTRCLVLANGKAVRSLNGADCGEQTDALLTYGDLVSAKYHNNRVLLCSAANGAADTWDAQVAVDNVFRWGGKAYATLSNVAPNLRKGGCDSRARLVPAGWTAVAEQDDDARAAAHEALKHAPRFGGGCRITAADGTGVRGRRSKPCGVKAKHGGLLHRNGEYAVPTCRAHVIISRDDAGPALAQLIGDRLARGFDGTTRAVSSLPGDYWLTRSADGALDVAVRRDNDGRVESVSASVGGHSVVLTSAFGNLGIQVNGAAPAFVDGVQALAGVEVRDQGSILSTSLDGDANRPIGGQTQDRVISLHADGGDVVHIAVRRDDEDGELRFIVGVLAQRAIHEAAEAALLGGLFGDFAGAAGDSAVSSSPFAGAADSERTEELELVDGCVGYRAAAQDSCKRFGLEDSTFQADCENLVCHSDDLSERHGTAALYAHYLERELVAGVPSTCGASRTIRNVRDYGSYSYATIDDRRVDQSTPGCQDNALGLPEGFEIAPDTHAVRAAVAAGRWGSQCVVLASGVAVDREGGICSDGGGITRTGPRGECFDVTACPSAILVRSQVYAQEGLTNGGFEREFAGWTTTHGHIQDQDDDVESARNGQLGGCLTNSEENPVDHVISQTVQLAEPSTDGFSVSAWSSHHINELPHLYDYWRPSYAIEVTANYADGTSDLYWDSFDYKVPEVWQLQTVDVVPSQPMVSYTVNLRLDYVNGTACFDDVSIGEHSGSLPHNADVSSVIFGEWFRSGVDEAGETLWTFDNTTYAKFWSAWQQGYSVSEQSRGSSSQDWGYSIHTSADNAFQKWGAEQTISFIHAVNPDGEIVAPNQAQALFFTATAKAADVSGQEDEGFAAVLDVKCHNGRHQLGKLLTFATGTHDWETKQQLVRVHRRCAITDITITLVFAGHSGSAWFDGVDVIRVANRGKRTALAPLRGTFNDPHFVNLAGTAFDFHHRGEFLFVGDAQVELQARFEAFNQGSITTAAVAGLSDGNIRVQVDRSNEVLVNGQPVEFGLDNLAELDFLSAEEQELVVVSQAGVLGDTSSPLTYTVHFTETDHRTMFQLLPLAGGSDYFLNMLVELPEDSEEQTVGLLADANPHDHQALFDTYSLDEDTSLFEYELGAGTEDFFQDVWVPFDVKDADPAILANAEQACNNERLVGAFHDACVFDFIASNGDPVFEQIFKLQSELDLTDTFPDGSRPGSPEDNNSAPVSAYHVYMYVLGIAGAVAVVLGAIAILGRRLNSRAANGGKYYEQSSKAPPRRGSLSSGDPLAGVQLKI